MAQRINRIMVEVVTTYQGTAMKRANADMMVYGANVKRQEKQLLQLGRGAALGSGALGGLTRAVVFASTGFVGAYGLTYGIKSATDAAKEFNAEMELVSTQAGARQAEVGKMSKALLQLAPSLGQAPMDLAKGLYHLESAGIRGSKALDAIRVAAKGAAIGHAGLEDTVNALVGAFKSGISGAGNFTHTMAVLSSVVGAGNIRMNELEGALGTGILSAGKAFGLTIQDVGAALATLSVGAVPVQEAATRLRMSFSLLGGAGSEKAKKALGEIGLTTRRLAHDLRSGGIVKAIGDLRSHLSKLSPIDQVRTLTQAFGGGRFATSIITLVQQFDLLKKSFDRIDTGAKRFGSSWAHTQKTAEFATMRFHAALKVLQIEFGQALLPELTKGATAVSDWIDRMSKTGKLQRDMKTAGRDLVAVFRAFGVAVKDALPTLQNLYHIGKSISDVFGGLAHVMELLASAFIFFKLKGMSQVNQGAKEITKSSTTATNSVRGLGAASVTTAAQEQSLAATSKRAAAGMNLFGASAATATKEATGSLFMTSKGAVVPRGAVPVSDAPLRRVFTAGPATPTPEGLIYSGPSAVDRRQGGYPIGSRPASYGARSVFVGGPATPTPSKPVFTPEGGLMQSAPQIASRAQAIEKATALGMRSMVAWSTKTVDLMTFINQRLATLGQTSRLPMAEVTALEGRAAMVQRATQLGMSSQMAWFTKTSELLNFIQARLVQLTAQVAEAESTMYLPPSYTPKPAPIPTTGERLRGFASRAGGGFRNIGAGLSTRLSGNPLGYGFGASFLAPAALSAAGAPAPAGSIVQGAGFGLIASSFIPRLNPVAGMAIGAGLAARSAIPGPAGSIGGNVLAGAGAGAALGTAIAPEFGGTVIGAVGGAIVGLGASLISLRHNSESAAKAIGKLADKASATRAKLPGDRRAITELKEQTAIDISQRDQAKASRDTARANVRDTTRGTKEHILAVHALNAAQAQYDQSIRQVTDDEKALGNARKKYGKDKDSINILKPTNEIFKQFLKISEQVRMFKLTPDAFGILPTQVEVARKYADQMNELADSLQKQHPRLAAIARALAQIATNTNAIPDSKTITIKIKAQLKMERYVKRAMEELGSAAFSGDYSMKIPPYKGPKQGGTGGTEKPHEYAIPLDLQLEAAKAGTQGKKAQIKADRDLLHYTQEQIKSGRLTKQGLIDAYNQEKSLEDDIASLTGKKKRKGAMPRLAEILPPRFTSQIQRAQASLSNVQVSGTIFEQLGALGKLETAFEKALGFLKAENLHGQKRLLQIKEEAALTEKIAGVRKQIKDLMAQAIDAARQQVGTLFQGPVLAPTAEQEKTMLGMKPASARRLTSDVRGQTALYNEFNKDLKRLQQRGAPKELIKELKEQGTSALPYIRSLLAANKADFKAFLKAFSARESAVHKYAVAQIKADKVIIHANSVREARRQLEEKVRNPSGRRGSTSQHAPQTGKDNLTPTRADGGMVGIPVPARAYADGGIAGKAPDNVRGAMATAMQEGGKIQPVSGGVYRVAEAGHPEMVIPLDPAKKERAMHLLHQSLAIIGRAGGGIMRYAEGGLARRGVTDFADGGIPHRTSMRKQYPASPTDPNMKHQLNTESARFINRRSELLLKGEIALNQGRKAEAYQLFEQARLLQLRRLGQVDEKGRPMPFKGPLTPEIKFIVGPLADFFIPATTSNRRMFANLWHNFKHKPTLLNAGMLGMAVAAFVPGVGGALGRSSKAARLGWEALAGEDFVKSERKFLMSGKFSKGGQGIGEMGKLGTEDWARNMFYNNETKLNKWIRGHVNAESLRGLPREQRVILRTLIRSMTSHRLPKDVVLFRGVNHDLLHTMRRRGGELGGPSGELPQSGETLKDRGILTTTVSDQEAKTFARGSYSSRRDSAGVLLKIHAHKGQHYLAGNPFEHEVLFPPGSEMKVLRVQKIMTESYKEQQKTIKLFLASQKKGVYPRLITRMDGPDIAFKNPATGSTSFWGPGIYEVAGEEHFLPHLSKGQHHLDMVTVDLKKRVPKFGKGGIAEPTPGGVYRVAEAGHPEMVIPLDPAKRERAMHLIDKTMKIVSRSAGGMVEKMTNCYRDGGIVPVSYEMGGLVQSPISYREGGLVKPTFAVGGPNVRTIVRCDHESPPIKLQILMDGHDITNQVTIRQERKKANSVAQVRGRHYGIVAT